VSDLHIATKIDITAMSLAAGAASDRTNLGLTLHRPVRGLGLVGERAIVVLAFNVDLDTPAFIHF